MDEVSRIVQVLASLPGSMAMNVISRKFPRLGPAEPGTTYQEETKSFASDSIPDGLRVPADVEEVVITLQGTLPQANARNELVNQLNEFFDTSEIAGGWDVRAKFSVQPTDGHAYELTIFKNPASGRSDAYA
jgi:hypothetical protein